MRDVVPPATELRLDLAPDLPVIHAGISELQQVIHNLLENAAEALDGHPGIIEIRTSQCELSAGDLGILYPDQQLIAGRYVRLEVTDNGCGIPEEISGRIFDPFFTTKFVGRGLGLSAVQGIVRAHSGAIRVESSMHHGTRVEVVLPVEPALAFEGLGDVYAPRTARFPQAAALPAFFPAGPDGRPAGAPPRSP